MRHISRKINLSHYKSFIQGKIKSIKNGVVFDVTKPTIQRQYNITSNYSMMPVSCEVENGGKSCGIWSWYTLHKAYSFFKNHKFDDICFDNVDSYSDMLFLLGVNESDFEEKYKLYRDDIINYVDQNISSGTKLSFNVSETTKTRCQSGYTQTCIALPINITNNIDNLGQVSNLLEEWKEKEVYHSGNTVAFANDAWYATSAVTESATAYTTPDGERSDLEGDDNDIYEIYESGYTWNNTFKESVFGNLTFHEKDGYIERTSPTLPWELAIKNFASSGCLDCVIVNDKAEEIETFEQEDDFIIYNNEIYLIKDYYFVEDFDCKKNKLLVQFSCGIPYIDYDGEQIVGYKDGGNYLFEYKFVTFKSNTAVEGTFVDNVFWEKETDYVNIRGEYYEICGKNTCKTFLFRDVWYVVKNDNKAYSYTLSGINYNPSYILGEISFTELNIDSNSIIIKTENRDAETLQTISGTTASRLTMFRKPNIVDNLGNEFEASFGLSEVKDKETIDIINIIDGNAEEAEDMSDDSNTEAVESNLEDDSDINAEGTSDDSNAEDEESYPKDDSDEYKYKGLIRPNKGDYLSLPYSIGSAVNLKEIDENIYIGDIISCIKFYVGSKELADNYTASTNKRLEDIYKLKYTHSVSEQDDGTFKDNYTQVEDNTEDDNVDTHSEYEEEATTIKNKPITFEEYLSATNQKLKCEIIYNLGAVIRATTDDSFELYDNDHKGVEYHDVYELNKLSTIYGRGVSNKYIVYMFSMVGEPLDEPFNRGLNEVKSTFFVEIPIFKKHETTENEDPESKYSECTQPLFTGDTYPFDVYHGFMYAPTYMEEYNIGTAYQEKVFEDIYINRGISSAFEKHLKLQEIETFKDLENYSNGGFFSISTIN